MKKTSLGSLLPALTNAYLKVNASQTSFTDVKMPYSYIKSDDSYLFPEAFAGMGISEEVSRDNRERSNFVRTRELFEGDEEHLSFVLNDLNPILADQHVLTTKPGFQSTYTVELTAEKGAFERNSQILVDVCEDAKVHLILVTRSAKENVLNLAVMGRVAEGGFLKITNIEMGEGKTNFHYRCDLYGYEAKTTVGSAYVVSGKGKLDLFYDIRHLAPYTESHIRAYGPLLDEAYKSFRGTLDFRKHAYGSRGDEEEFAILMSDKAKSVAVPLLLAEEDDIQGNHAASAGRMDENLLFYLMSRGFEKRKAESIIVESKISIILDRVTDATLRSMLQQEVHENNR